MNKFPLLPGTAVMFGLLLCSNATSLGGSCGRGGVSSLFQNIMLYAAVGVFG